MDSNTDDAASLNVILEGRKDRKKTRRRLLSTACNGVALFILGMTLAMRGPAFADLLLISGVDVEKGSAYVTGVALGYMLGSFLAGSLYNRLSAKRFLIFVSMFASAILQGLTPHCTSFIVMLAVHVLIAVFWGACETTVNTIEVHSWEGNSDSAMQFLSFAYSLGGIIGPLIVEPFLAPKTHISENASAVTLVNGSAGIHNDKVLIGPDTNWTFAINDMHERFTKSLYDIQITRLHSVPHSPLINSSDIHIHYLNNVSLGGEGLQTEIKSKIHYAYLIAAILTCIAATPFCIIGFKNCRRKHKDQIIRENESESRLPSKVYVILVGLISMFYFFYVAVEDSFLVYLTLFVSNHLDWSKEMGAVLTSLYWGCSCVIKLASVILVRFVNPTIILFLSTLGIPISMVVFTVSAHFQVDTMIWISTALLALSQSYIFGGGFAWTDAHLLKFDGRVTSCAMIFGSLGAVVNPMFLGVTIKELSLMSFPYILMFQAIVTFLLFLAMLIIAKPYVTKKYGPVQH